MSNIGVDQLGTQMCQYAILYHISRQLGHELVFLKQFMNIGKGVQLFEAFDLPNRVIEESYRLGRNFFQRNHRFIKFMPEPGLNLDSRIENLEESMNYDFIGYFGLYRHWAGSSPEIFELFKFRRAIYHQAFHNIKFIRSHPQSDAELVSVHFRRTDYLTDASLNLKLDYYENALKKFIRGNYKLVVFSDEISFCKSLGIFGGYPVYFSEDHTSCVDLCMMSLCDHHIIANSSFSLWGALLNKNGKKIVVCPRNYIGQIDKKHLFWNGNYYPEEWIAIGNDPEYVERGDTETPGPNSFRRLAHIADLVLHGQWGILRQKLVARFKRYF
jgi:hypothetical protein